MDNRSEGRRFVQIDFRQNKQVYLKFPDSNTCLIEWLPLSNSDEELEPNDDLKKSVGAFEKFNDEPEKAGLGRSRKKISDPMSTSSEEENQLRYALIRVLSQLNDDNMYVICAQVISNNQLIFRKLPENQPKMCTYLINELASLERLADLTKYLEQEEPGLMAKIEQEKKKMRQYKSKGIAG